jgi:hypothetical protein
MQEEEERGKPAPENDSSLVAGNGKRGYWDKVPPPHYRKSTQTHIRSLADAQGPDAARDQRWYAGYMVKGNLDVNPRTYGLHAGLSRFRPSIEENDMSLIQILVGNNDKSHLFQSLEAGWKRDSHGEPQLFIFFTTNDYGPREWGVCGFVLPENNMGYVYLDKRPNAFRPGKTFLPCSHIDAKAQLVTFLQWRLVKNTPGVADGWYLYIDDAWHGYFPLRFFERNVPDKKLTLADHANLGDFYGEVKDNDYDRNKDSTTTPQKRTTTDMGSGRWPTEGFGRAAHIESIQRLVSLPGSQDHWEMASKRTWVSYVKLKLPAADPKMYKIRFIPESDTEWGSHAYVGGPGYPVAQGKWDEWENISDTTGKRGPQFDPLACVCLLQRQKNYTYLFSVGKGGIVWGCWQTEQRDWSGFNTAKEWMKMYFGEDETPKFDPKAKLTVVARTPSHLDIFAVAKDGRVYLVSWVDGSGWKPWRNISGDNDRHFPSGAPITAISRHSKQLDIFINAGPGIWTSSWTENTDPTATPPKWAEWVSMNTGTANIPASAELLVLSKGVNDLTVVATGQNGHVYASSWRGNLGWTGFGDVGISAPDVSVTPPRPSRFAPGGKVAGVVRGSRLDLFAVSSDRSLYTCHWTSADGWSGVGENKFWTPLGFGTNASNVKIFSSVTSDVAALTRGPLGDMDVFVTGTGGQIYRTHWNSVLGTWSTGMGANGWDEGIGSERKVDHARGFHIGAVSRNEFSLSVVTISNEGTALATAYEGTSL